MSVIPTAKASGLNPHRRSHQPKRNRFWEYVGKTDTCWLWTGRIGSGGYGMFGKIRAHRRSAQLAGLELPPRYHVHHTCGVKRCVRPDHLTVVTPDEHRRLHRQEIPAVCIHGHDLTGYNLREKPNGYWICRECDRLRKKRSRRRTLSS